MEWYSNKSLSTPVLFMVFNRPEKTLRVFNEIKKAQPRKLYIAADAPRPGNEQDVIGCKKVREIVKQVDWPCDVHYLFQEKNLGCCLAGKTAWDWLFSQEDEMIFIEDDGLPSTSFFFYCQELLEKYRNDDRIAYIGGVNYLVKSGSASYFFSRYCPPTYGMATWKRVYDLYEYNIESYEGLKDKSSFKKRFWWSLERDKFFDKYDSLVHSIRKGKRENTYDKQMSFLCWKYGKYNIHPNYNLVTNIGFDEEGTNTPDSKELAAFFSRPQEEMDTLIHPVNVDINKKDEKLLFEKKVLQGMIYRKVFLRYYVMKALHNLHHFFDK